jgi:hypothetical protein
VQCEQDAERKPAVPYATAFQGLRERVLSGPLRECKMATSSQRFSACLGPCDADLSMLIGGNPEKNYPYAGLRGAAQCLDILYFSRGTNAVFHGYT